MNDSLGTGEPSEPQPDLVVKQAEQRMHSIEDRMHDRHPVLWWITLLVPITMVLVAIVVAILTQGLLFTIKLVVAAGITFVFLGRLVILLGQTGELEFDVFLSPNQLFFLVTYMDLAVAILVAFHIGLLFDLPYLGKRAKSLFDDAKFVMNRFPAIQQAAFLGLTAFISFPLAATGAIGGSILGTLLGLGRIRVFFATVVGCLIGNFLMLKFAYLMEPITRSPWVRYSSIVVIVGLVILMEWRYRKGVEKYRQAHEAPSIE
jgi:uncharacterized membrane protein